MNILLLFFALPIATIIISIALQKIFKNPFLVAAIIFSIFLVVTFIINDLNFLVATIVYTFISLIVAFIVSTICRFLRNLHEEDDGDTDHCDNLENNQVINNNLKSDFLGLTDGLNDKCCNSRNINVYPNIDTKRNTRCYRGRRVI